MDEARVNAARSQLEHRYSRIGVDPKRLPSTSKGTIVDPTLEHVHDRSTVDGGPMFEGGEDRPPDLRPSLAGMALPETVGEFSEGSPSGLRGAAEGSPAGLRGAAPVAEPRPLDAREGRDAATLATKIVLGPVVGTGGMGIVNVAEQTALRREVAVKRVRPERTNDAAINSLLREAWVTGALEHPNIVPIHLLIESGRAPQVVMKRIEGVTWDALLETPSLVDEFRGQSHDHAPKARTQDRLLFHLRILTEVCQAIHFAHSRGVLHLDLKPENVMVGRFGEVYVVDWGIAASVPGLGPEWLPDTTTIRSIRGTPSWMSPELATADSDNIGVRSDVYLLGGLLHAVLTDNDQRHHGDGIIDLLASAYLSDPITYGPRVPAELAELANRATARDPQQRPSSAAVFRQAIEDYLEHRHSTEIEARATLAKDSLLALFARAQKGYTEGTQVGQNLRRDFLECRFGFRQALEIWPDNERAKQGLQQILRAMATFALDHEQLERAAESVAEISPPDPELDRRLRALRVELQQRHFRLLELERDASIDAFREKRSGLAFGAACLFLVWNVFCGFMHRAEAYTFTVDYLLWFNTATIAIFSGSAWLVRRSLLTTATNRRLVVLFGSGFVAVLTFWLAAWVHNRVNPAQALGPLQIVALSNWCYTYFALAVAFTVDMRGVWVAVPVTLAAALSPFAEDFAFDILGIEGFVCGSWLAFIWRKSAQPPKGSDASPGAGSPPR